MRRNFPSIILYLSILYIVFMTAAAFAQIPCLSGFIRDANGVPVVDADLDFDNVLTGQRMYTPGDNTDQFGFYRVCIIPGLYRVSYAPPSGTHLVGKIYQNIDLRDRQSRALDVTLDFGAVISGIVIDSAGAAIDSVDLDVDTVGGGRVYTPDDNSDSMGSYWVVVPPGNYRIRFTPPSGSRWQGLELDSIIIQRDTVIEVSLIQGVMLSGQVTDASGTGVQGMQIDLRIRDTGENIFLPFNETDSIGLYRVAAPRGIYDLRFIPPIGSRLVGVQIDSFALSSDRIWNQEVEIGIMVNAHVYDSTGIPIVGADFDFTRDSTAVRVFTPNDKTDDSGRVIIAVLPDIYTIRVDPPPGTIFDRLTIPGLSVQNDTSFSLTLHEVQRVQLSGRVTNQLGTGLTNIEIDFAAIPGNTHVNVPNNKTDTTGFFQLAAPVGIFNVSYIPPRGNRFVAKKYEGINIARDTIWNTEILDSGLIATMWVISGDGEPVEGVDFDFMPESIGTEIFAPYDNTDIMGMAIVTIPSDIYDITLTPPLGSSLQTKSIADFHLAADTQAVFVLTENQSLLPVEFVLKQNYPNPFNQETYIPYAVLDEGNVLLAVYNICGQRIRIIKQGFHRAGLHVARWDGRDEYGEQIASGIFFYQMQMSQNKKTLKMSLLK